MPSLSGYFQRLLHHHSKFVDFLGASLIISLCLILLLPKVHDSFLEEDKDDDNSTSAQTEYQNQQLPLENNNDEPPTVTTIVGDLDQVVVNQDHDHINGHHHHDHKLPMGELIICIGFFAFYCIGLGLSKTRNSNDSEPLLAKERGKVSTNCCSSTRCPSSREQETQFGQVASTSVDIKTQEQFPDVGSKFLNSTETDDECVFTLNRHHNHHTHSSHHEHQPTPNQKVKKVKENNYGAITRAQTLPELSVGEEIVDHVRKRGNQIYVEEISITRRSRDEEMLGWPLSIKVTLFGLLLIAALLVFDMNIKGLIESIKVFRAAATGALLYVAFFLVLPRSSAGCNSCAKEGV